MSESLGGASAPLSTATQSAKLNKMLGVQESGKTTTATEKSSAVVASPESTRDWAGKSVSASFDIIDSYIQSHHAEMADREKHLVKRVTKDIEGQKKSRTKRSRTTRSIDESHSSSEDDNETKQTQTPIARNASKRLDLGGEKAFQKQLEGLNFEEFEGQTVEQMVDLAWKRRKTEVKDQKELLKTLQAKHKAHQKKILDELKNVSV